MTRVTFFIGIGGFSQGHFFNNQESGQGNSIENCHLKEKSNYEQHEAIHSDTR